MITRLTSSTQAGIGQIGGKASGLVRLQRAGLTVPQAWCVPAAVSLDPAKREVLVRTELPQWWSAMIAEFPGALWAVRSSAVAEDLDHASFAGVYDTVLGIGTLDALVAAVQDCWRAMTHDRAVAYRAASGIDSAGGIALVLQRMLRPRAAGVLMTADPLRPFEDRIVVDAAYGLGASVVSGATDPDHFVLRRGGEVLRRRLGAKRCETVGQHGLHTREVDPARRAQMCLSTADLDALRAVARIVDTAIGPRRDLEWAIEGDTVYLLQDRPITGLPSQTPNDVFSRRYGDEYLADYCMPLVIDLCLRWIEDTRIEVDQMVDPHQSDLPSTRIHHGYAYISGNWMIRQIRALPIAARSWALAWFPPMFADKIMREPFDRRLFISTLRAPYSDRGRGPITKNLAALQRHCAEVDRLITPKLHQDYSALSMAQLRGECELVDHLGLQHFRVIRWGMAYNPLLHAVLAKLLTRWCDDQDGRLYESIISGLPGTMTAQINREVFQLGTLARADPRLRAALLVGGDVNSVRGVAPGSAFWAAFDTFLATHGHRAATRDISQPRWRETPRAILAMVAAQVRPADPPQDPAHAESAAIARRHTAERTALQRAGRVRGAVLRKVIALTQQYTVYRENQRYHLDYLLAYLRYLMLEHGRRLTRRSVLAEPSQVFFLRAAELRTLTESEAMPEDLATSVEQRRAHWLRHRDRLPAVYLFDDVEVDASQVDDEPDQISHDGAILGAPASHGVARGPTKVVHDLPELAHIQPGDILVTTNIDPGWTSVFPIISGLITATGGVLSHGAILAREYGIATVTGVKDATTILPTGTLVELNGASGTVRIIDPVWTGNDSVSRMPTTHLDW